MWGTLTICRSCLWFDGVVWHCGGGTVEEMCEFVSFCERQDGRTIGPVLLAILYSSTGARASSGIFCFELRAAVDETGGKIQKAIAQT